MSDSFHDINRNDKDNIEKNVNKNVNSQQSNSGDGTKYFSVESNQHKVQNGKFDRRSDEPSELSFENSPESLEEKLKRKNIESALRNRLTKLDQWREYAISAYGLVNDDLRKQIWPLLVGVDPTKVESVPKIDELKSHPEYNQVILDVNRSLKRFPPGIPYEKRIALQDQLTVLILRVIIKYPKLKYYQGYHDVAITFLLVVGEEKAFHVMEYLSTNQLVEFMQETMEPTQKRLLYIYPIVRHENEALCDFLEKSMVGTLFALPWYLTWFGHSLNSYKTVVRLYDFFLASPFLLPLYVTAAIVLHQADNIFREECDMANLHCLLSQLPDDLPFEYLLKKGNELYTKYPPEEIEMEVEELIQREKEKQEIDERLLCKRRKQYNERRAGAKSTSSVFKFLPRALNNKRSVIVTTAFSILFGICAYYYKQQLMAIGVS